MNDVVPMGIDLAKNVFAVYGVDATARVVFRRTVSRAKLPELVALDRANKSLRICIQFGDCGGSRMTFVPVPGELLNHAVDGGRRTVLHGTEVVVPSASCATYSSLPFTC